MHKMCPQAVVSWQRVYGGICYTVVQHGLNMRHSSHVTGCAAAVLAQGCFVV